MLFDGGEPSIDGADLLAAIALLVEIGEYGCAGPCPDSGRRLAALACLGRWPRLETLKLHAAQKEETRRFGRTSRSTPSALLSARRLRVSDEDSLYIVCSCEN